jgi:hypothetical protein
MDGMTLRACMVLAPRSPRESNVGQLASVNASGRTPSSMMKTTGGMGDSLFCEHSVVERKQSKPPVSKVFFL